MDSAALASEVVDHRERDPGDQHPNCFRQAGIVFERRGRLGGRLYFRRSLTGSDKFQRTKNMLNELSSPGERRLRIKSTVLLDQALICVQDIGNYAGFDLRSEI